MQMDTATNGYAESTAESAILEELGSGAVLATELRRRINERLGLDVPQLKHALDALIAARKIHAQRRKGKGSRTVEAYVVGAPPPPPPSPRELAPDAILAELRAQALAPAELKARLEPRIGKLAASDLKSVLAELLRAKRLFAVYKVGKTGKPGKTIERYTLQSPPPDSFVEPVVELFRDSRRSANAAGVDDGAFVKAFFRALAEAGVPIAGGGAAASSPAEDGAEVMSAVRDLVHREGRGALIPMRKLRAALTLSKRRFDAAVLQLYAADAIILHHHDYVASLTERERDELVTDAHGNSYIGVALRGDS